MIIKKRLDRKARKKKKKERAKERKKESNGRGTDELKRILLDGCGSLRPQAKQS